MPVDRRAGGPTPSLAGRLPDFFQAAYPRARAEAFEKTGLLDLPDEPPFTLDQARHGTLPD